MKWSNFTPLLLIVMAVMTTAQYNGRGRNNNVESRGWRGGGRGGNPCGATRQVHLRAGGISHETVVAGKEICIELNRVSPYGSTQVDAFDPLRTGDVRINLQYLPIATIAIIRVNNASKEINDRIVMFQFLSANGATLGKSELMLTSLFFSLDVDSNRDGVVDFNSPFKNSWQWGKLGHGAIILANMDRDSETATTQRDSDDDVVSGHPDLQDMSLMYFHSDGPSELPRDVYLTLSTDSASTPFVRVFAPDGYNSPGQIKLLGPATQSANALYPGPVGRDVFHVEGLSYPHLYFDGFIQIHLTLHKTNEGPIFQDTVMLKVAPWIMTSLLLPPDIIFTSKADGNLEFISTLEKIVGIDMGIPVRSCPRKMCKDDRWIQDQLEFGYAEVPTKTPMSVVLESPRANGLSTYGETAVLGPNVGFVEYQFPGVTELDYFGNLEVTPPITVGRNNYPLGRIYYGTANYPGWKGRKISEALVGFLEAQQVQKPIELFSDWLFVGHVDEFMTFVPATNTVKGFKLLIASPRKFYEMMKEIYADGLASVPMFVDKPLSFFRGNAETTVGKILDKDEFYDINIKCQDYIDYNRKILMDELGLTNYDVIEIPTFFTNVRSQRDGKMRSVSYFPNMVNLLVLNKDIFVPKPFGPIIRGVDVLENYVRNQLQPLGVNIVFLDDWLAFHVYDGDIHCGTNVRRKPYTFKWWNMNLN